MAQLTRAARLWCMIQRLSAQRCTVRELAIEYNVAERTIYDDLRDLRGAPFFQDVRTELLYRIVAERDCT